MNSKVLLVDDNHLTVEGLLCTIDWSALQIDSLLTAYDGQTALQIIKESSPSLIISDITMPGLSGLELTEQVRLLCPSSKVILISAYDKFEYAKSAVRLGAYDYVEKPIDYSYLTQIIRNALSDIASEQKNRELLKKSIPAMEEQFMRTLLYSAPESLRDSMSLYADFLHIPLECSCCMVLQVIPENPDQLRQTCGLEEYHLRFMHLRERVLEEFRSFAFSFVVQDLDGFVCIIGSLHLSEEDFRDHIRHTCETISEQYQDTFPLLFGMGSIEHNLQHLQNSFRQSEKALLSHFFFPDRTILEAVSIKGVNSSLILQREGNEDELIRRICKNDRYGIRSWIDEFTASFPMNADYRHLIHTLLYSLIARILKFCYEMDVDTTSFEKELLHVLSTPEKFQTITQIAEWLEDICCRLCDSLQKSVMSYHQLLCDSAVEYIDAHYCDSELSLNQIAEQIRIAPSYLSSLFKKNKQQNISNYITQVRIENACLLLRTTSLPLKEISFMVGYANQYYFSSCFKKVTGETPSAYREGTSDPNH